MHNEQESILKHFDAAKRHAIYMRMMAAVRGPRKRENGETNREFFLSNTHFHDACLVAGVLETPRQASKFRNRKGAAYAASRNQNFAELVKIAKEPKE